LARLGNRSLGALLFSHAGFVRGPLVSGASTCATRFIPGPSPP